jgi:hypothetical protein
MSASTDEAKRQLDAHGQTLDTLHQKLAALPGADTAKLAQATAKYKAAHQAYHDDALDCMH